MKPTYEQLQQALQMLFDFVNRNSDEIVNATGEDLDLHNARLDLVKSLLDRSYR